MKRNDFEDDGRTIADMSGIERPSLFSFRKPQKREEVIEKSQKPWENDGLNKKQGRQYIFATILAGLAVAGVFIVCGAIAIALMTLFWKH